jgi:hypothetical protein
MSHSQSQALPFLLLCSDPLLKKAAAGCLLSVRLWRRLESRARAFIGSRRAEQGRVDLARKLKRGNCQARRRIKVAWGARKLAVPLARRKRAAPRLRASTNGISAMSRVTHRSGTRHRKSLPRRRRRRRALVLRPPPAGRDRDAEARRQGGMAAVGYLAIATGARVGLTL